MSIIPTIDDYRKELKDCLKWLSNLEYSEEKIKTMDFLKSEYRLLGNYYKNIENPFYSGIINFNDK